MRAKWLVSLSDGQTMREDKMLEKNSSRSAWLQLRDYLLENKGKHITSIQLIINGYVYNTPNVVKSKDACRLFFHKRSDFIFVGGNDRDEYYGFSYRSGEYRHYFWVNLKGNETFCEVRNINDRSQEKNIELFYDGVEK